MEEDELLDPIHIRILRPDAVMTDPDRLSDPIQ